MHARHGAEVSEPGRIAARQKWMTKADPEGVLSLPERERRAKALERAHMVRIAFLSVRARRKV